MYAVKITFDTERVDCRVFSDYLGAKRRYDAAFIAWWDGRSANKQQSLYVDRARLIWLDDNDCRVAHARAMGGEGTLIEDTEGWPHIQITADSQH